MIDSKTSTQTANNSVISRIRRRTAFLFRLGAAIEQQAQQDREARRKTIIRNAVKRWAWQRNVERARARKGAK